MHLIIKKSNSNEYLAGHSQRHFTLTTIDHAYRFHNAADLVDSLAILSVFNEDFEVIRVVSVHAPCPGI